MVIYFDLDGTLLDVKNRHYLYFMSFLRTCALKNINISLIEYWNKKREMNSDINILEEYGGIFGKTNYDKKKISIIEEPFLLAEDKLFEFTNETLLIANNIAKVNLITHRTNNKNTIQQLKDLNIYHYFQQIFLSDSLSKSKAKLLSEVVHNNKSERQILIGDTEIDFIAAKELGVECFLVESGSRNRDYLLKICQSEIIIFKNVYECINYLAT